MRRRSTPAYDFIAGALFLILIFQVIPCVWGIGPQLLSLRRDELASVGPAATTTGGCRRIQRSRRPYSSRSATALGAVPLSLIIALFIALALDEKWFRGKTFARTLFFMAQRDLARRRRLRLGVASESRDMESSTPCSR